jgi:hypothetical protein
MLPLTSLRAYKAFLSEKMPKTAILTVCFKHRHYSADNLAYEGRQNDRIGGNELMKGGGNMKWFRSAKVMTTLLFVVALILASGAGLRW